MTDAQIENEDEEQQYEDILGWLTTFATKNLKKEQIEASNWDDGERKAEHLRKLVLSKNSKAACHLDEWEAKWEECPYLAVLQEMQ